VAEYEDLIKMTKPLDAAHKKGEPADRITSNDATVAVSGRSQHMTPRDAAQDAKVEQVPLKVRL
jgi:hypothetical protein